MKKEEQEFERIVVVSVIPQGTDERRIKENLDELEFLALTAGARSEKRFTQRLERANSRTYVGTGKLEEIKSYINEHEIKLVIFDDELSPSQLRNLERELQCRILDRTNLILDIFDAALDWPRQPMRKHRLNWLSISTSYPA